MRRLWWLRGALLLVGVVGLGSLLPLQAQVQIQRGWSAIFSAIVDQYIDFTVAGVRVSGDGDGAITFLGLGNGSDEDFTFNLDDTANTIGWSSSTGVTTWTLTGLTTMNFGAAGVRLTQDEDGALTLLGLGNGSDEDLTLNLDDTANTIAMSSSTGATVFTWTGDLGLGTETVTSFGGSTRLMEISASIPGIRLTDVNGANQDWEVTANSGELNFVAETGGGSIRVIVEQDGSLRLLAPQITAGAHATTGSTGEVRGLVYTTTVTATTCSAAFIAAALTADCTIATLPANTKLVSIYADVTEAFTCSGTCTGTKTIGAGISAGGVEILAAGLNVAATGQLGLLDANMGTSMTRAAAIQGGYLPNWSGTSPVIVRFTSGTGNWGDGMATFVNAGSVTFYLETVRAP